MNEPFCKYARSAVLGQILKSLKKTKNKLTHLRMCVQCNNKIKKIIFTCVFVICLEPKNSPE